MVDDPLRTPGAGLAPPIRVRMEGTVVDVGEGEFGVEVSTVARGVGPVVSSLGEVEFTYLKVR